MKRISYQKERCWQGARIRTDEKANDASNEEGVKKIILPRLQLHDYMSSRQNVGSDPPTIKYRQFIEDTNGNQSVVWHQQMEKAYNKTYKIVHKTIAQTKFTNKFTFQWQIPDSDDSN